MPIIPYFPKKSSMLGNSSIAFSLKILKGRLLKMFMSQCNSDTKALDIPPEHYRCQLEAYMSSQACTCAVTSRRDDTGLQMCCCATET